MGVKQVGLLYHITHIESLRSILQNGGFLAQSIVQKDIQTYIDVANSDIQMRRSRTKIPIAPGGNLHEYVPFYFAPRSPMLYSICHQGGIEQEKIIYFITHTETIEQRGLPFVFTDAHAMMMFTKLYNDLADLVQVDWDIMKATIWTDSIDHPNRKSKRQAEFLVHEKMSLDACIGFATMNAKMQQELQPIVGEFNSKIPIGVRRQFYF